MGAVQFAHHASFNLGATSVCGCLSRCLLSCCSLLFLREAEAEVKEAAAPDVRQLERAKYIWKQRAIDGVLCFAFSGQSYGGTFMVVRTIKKGLQVRKGTLKRQSSHWD